MSRILQYGAEYRPVGSGGAEPAPAGRPGSVLTPVIDTVVKRSLGASYGFTTNSAEVQHTPWTPVSGQWFYWSGWIYIQNYPPTQQTFVILRSGAGVIVSFRITATGRIERATTPGSGEGVAIPLRTWWWLRLAVLWTSGANTCRVLAYKDGASSPFSDQTQTGIASSPDNIRVLTSSPLHNCGIRMDDCFLNSGDATAPNGFANQDESVIALQPVADSAVGANWRGGAGGSLSAGTYYQRIDRPYTALSHSVSTDASQLRNAVNGITNPAADIDIAVQSPSEAGMPVGAFPTTARVVAGFGDNSSVNQSQLALEGLSNPIITAVTKTEAPTSTTATWPSDSWNFGGTPFVINPVIAHGTRPVIRAGKRSANTNQLHLAALGLEVSYGPAPPPVEAKRFMAVA